jgi:hypothetical protein
VPAESVPAAPSEAAFLSAAERAAKTGLEPSGLFRMLLSRKAPLVLAPTFTSFQSLVIHTFILSDDNVS